MQIEVPIPKGVEVSLSPAPTRVLVLYQLDKNKKREQAALIEEFTDRASRGYPGEFEFVRLVDSFDGRDFGMFYQEFSRRVSGDEFQAAVAFFFADPRGASEAGNVALEVGFWLGRRGDHQLLLLCERGAEFSNAYGQLDYLEFTVVDDAVVAFRVFREQLLARADR